MDGFRVISVIVGSGGQRFSEISVNDKTLVVLDIPLAYSSNHQVTGRGLSTEELNILHKRFNTNSHSDLVRSLLLRVRGGLTTLDRTSVTEGTVSVPTIRGLRPPILSPRNIPRIERNEDTTLTIDYRSLIGSYKDESVRIGLIPQ